VKGTTLVRQPDVRLTQIRAPRIKANNYNREQISPCGLDFLKCAFAAPDFDSTGALGIPDNYVGRTLMSNQTLVANLNAPHNMDTYIVVSPFFGSAYFTATVNSGVQPGTLTSVNWPGYSNLGLDTNPGGAGTIGKFRYASLAAEIQPTMNQMNWAGNITCFRIPMGMTVTDAASVPNTPATVLHYQPSGIGNLSVVPFNNIYTAPFDKGAYAVSFNRTGSFLFNEVCGDDDDTTVSRVWSPGIGTSLTMPYRGHDSLDTIVFKISVPNVALDQSFILITWACVELQVVPSTFLYEFTSLSCPHDQKALEYYKMVAERLPVAVPYADNANFWSRIYNFIRNMSSTLSKVPGPIGDIASGVNLLTSGISSFRI
jgi:hypothetical protein